MDYEVKIYSGESVVIKRVGKGTNLLEFLRENDIRVDAVCGGKGTCGKCGIKVRGLVGEAGEQEKRLLGENLIRKGYRLSCSNNIESDIEIFPEASEKTAKIIVEGRTREVKTQPFISKTYAEIPRPDIEDQLPDIERLLMILPQTDTSDSLELLKELPELIRKNDYKITMVLADRELIAIEPGDTTKKAFGIAVDIGSTTIAAYLYNIVTGEKIDTYSVLNPQKKFGADVLARIDYASKSEEAQNKINEVLISCINGAVSYFASENEIDASDIYMMVFAGNTTMVHFLMNIPAKNIAVSPFIPVTTMLHIFNAGEMGLKINKYGKSIILPSVSGYVGADITAGVLACGMYEDEKISLLVDIGTNGEIVLGNNERLYSCSVAAGPAFEGANIKNGVGGITGAIDSVRFSDKLEISVIGNAGAVGICGSGIVDAIACMLSTGVADETGRIVDPDEVSGMAEELKERIVYVDGMKTFLLMRSEETAGGLDIGITQKDVREVQNAKAAIAAGIKVLAKRAGTELEGIEKVYLAGGFGNYINIESALAIGLIPRELEGRIESIGNSAGAGAALGLLSHEMLNKTPEIKKRTKYIELSASPDFVEEYVENMFF